MSQEAQNHADYIVVHDDPSSLGKPSDESRSKMIEKLEVALAGVRDGSIVGVMVFTNSSDNVDSCVLGIWERPVAKYALAASFRKL